MKQTIFLIVLILCLNTMSFAQEQSNSFEIKGKVIGAGSGKVYLQKFSDKNFITIDSTIIKDGKFKFSTTIELPELYGLSVDNQNPYLVFLENSKINIVLDTDNFRNSNVSGSLTHDLYMEYLREDNIKDVKIDEFIRKNPSSIVSAYVFYRFYAYRMTPDEIGNHINLLDKSLYNTQYVKVMRNLIEVLSRVKIGNKAVDFTLPDTTGSPVTLSDHFGKYILLDFWASWCGPCRKENPNLVKLYQKYKNKGFNIFGVSLDNKKENWVKAIHNDALTWPHVSDLTLWNSAAGKLYGIRAVPSNVLIDPSGTIIGRNLKGEELEKKLEEIFSKAN